jgi:hypothetical protein
MQCSLGYADYYVCEYLIFESNLDSLRENNRAKLLIALFYGNSTVAY